jgi:hypothetical protein
LWGTTLPALVPPQVLYVTFFRNAIDKFVSGIMYQKKDQDYSFDGIVELIQKRVKGELGQGKYREGYSAYLLTPQQKQHHYADYSQNSTVEARTNQIIQNLDRGNVLVGILERMSESLELLAFAIDKDQEQLPLFESFGMKPRLQAVASDEPAESGAISTKKNNPSKFSTSSVVEELQKDAQFWGLLEEYVKYDDQIYQRALRIHEAQYRSIK